MASSPAPPTPHPGIPSLSALPSPPLNIPCCISALLSWFFSLFYHLTSIFVIFSTLGAPSSLISPFPPSPPLPATYLSLLYCFSPSPIGAFSLFLFLLLRFSFFLLRGTRGSLSVLLPTAHTHDLTWRQTHLPRVR